MRNLRQLIGRRRRARHGRIVMQNGVAHRETWLHAVAEALRSPFAAAGYPIPSNIRVTCGFPSARATSLTNRAVGQCWASTASKDGHFEIMVSPVVDDPVRVAGILAHELIHAAVGTEHGHKGPFRKAARAIGLEGRMTATTESDAFKRSLRPILAGVGAYPHAELDARSGRQKQTTRLIKCECPVCGFPIRTTRQWLDDLGPPLCPRHGEMIESVDLARHPLSP